jgi:hypothetical protein
LLLVLGLLVATQGAGYYSRSGPLFSAGVKSGATLGTLWGQGTDVLEDELREDFIQLGDEAVWAGTAGLFAAVHFSDFAALQVELLYDRSGKGYEGTTRFSGTEYELAIALDYLTIPVLLKLMVPFLGDGFRPHLIVGPYLSARLSAQVNKLGELPPGVKSLGILTGFRAKEEADDETRAIDAGAAIGLGVDIRLGPGYLQLEIRGSSGFVGVFDERMLGANAEEIRNGMLWFTGGYLLEF